MNEIEDYLQLSKNELFQLLGEEILPSVRTMDLRKLEQKAEEKLNAAKCWLKENHDILQDTVCNHPMVKNVLNESGPITKKELLAGIADAISLVFTSVTPFLVAVIIYRGGIHTYCSSTRDGHE